MDQPPPSPKVLYDDTNLRLVVEGKSYTLEYLTGGEVQFSEQYDCKLCAIRGLLLATLQLSGACHCSPSALRLEDLDVIQGFAGGLN